MLSLVLFGGEHQGSLPPLPRAFAADPEPHAPTFNPEVVRRLKDSPLATAIDARKHGDLERARVIATSALGSAQAEDAPLLRYVAAHAARDLEALREAIDLITPLAESDHPLAAWARLDLASWLEAKDPARGLAVLEPLFVGSSELEGFPGLVSAKRTHARLLANLGRTREAIAELEGLVSEAGDESAALPIALPLAELLAKEEEPAAKIRAYTILRRIAHRSPGTRAGRKADELADALEKELGSETREKLRSPLVDDKLARADALLSGQRYEDAERAYIDVEKAIENDPVVACRARFGRAKALLDQRSRERGSSLMAEVAESCDHDADQRAWARYHAARGFSAIGKNDLALLQYEALEREAPEHRLADDALFRAAKVAREMGDSEGVRTRLSALPERYPHGDMRPRARFQLAWQWAAEGDYARAEQELLRAEQEGEENHEDVRGRATYWRARFLVELGRRRDAADVYANLVSSAPLTYYGQQAFSRLRSLDPARAREFETRFRQNANTPLSFEWRPELERPAFQRALALLRVGDVTLAGTELSAAGLLGENADLESHMLVVALLERAGAPEVALDIARKRMSVLLARAPSGRDRLLFELAYPRAFAPLVEDAAKRVEIPSAFLRAVAREESGFHAAAVSRVGARGLIQLLPSTAKSIAKGLDVRFDPEALSDPQTNLTLGAKFIATLAEQMRGQLALVPAAYNAGPGITGRWLTTQKDEPLDMWIENIPYDETRHYTRRVIQSYGVYSYLETGKLLELPNELPAL